VAQWTRGAELAARAERARRITATFGRVYLRLRATRFLARHLDPPDMQERWSEAHRRSAEEIHAVAVDLQGLILKGCQFLGARADVLPREYVQVLSRLQDRVPPRPFRAVRRAVERELGRPMAEVFASFEPEPIAAASLAQVHRAHLRDGRRVAVKVQYPEIAALVRGDLSNLRLLFRAVDWLERDFDPMPLVEELADAVPRELDFASEARNAERIAAALAHRGDVLVPTILHEHTCRRLLVMELVEGIKITDVAGLERAGVDPARVARTLVEVFAEQILSHGFFHADPHPGNLLVLPEGPRIVLLDFGLAKELPPGFRGGVQAFVAALLLGDAERMGRALLALGFRTRDGSPEGLEQIADLLLRVGGEIRSRGGMDPRTAARLREEIPEEVRRNPIVRIPNHLVLLGRVIGLLSGVTHALGVKADWIGAAAPYAVGPPGGPGAAPEAHP
jgi:ubiquinone biosynthesis protein